MNEIYSLEHSQYSEDKGLFQFHISPLQNAIEQNLKDCVYNQHKENKWQIVFIGSADDCQKVMEGLLKKKAAQQKREADLSKRKRAAKKSTKKSKGKSPA